MIRPCDGPKLASNGTVLGGQHPPRCLAKPVELETRLERHDVVRNGRFAQERSRVDLQWKKTMQIDLLFGLMNDKRLFRGIIL